jgi:tripartite-type tricarboxylate transporter receptor subunit TctC
VQADGFKKLGVNEGLVLIAAPPDEFARYYRSEMERWRKVIEDAGIKVE